MDSYLHKKFKKQLSIEPRPVVAAAAAAVVVVENAKKSDDVETSSPSTIEVQTSRRRHDDNTTTTTNHHHHTVPNSSTNRASCRNDDNDNAIINSRIVKSSISLVENNVVNLQQSRDISYNNDDSFDKFIDNSPPVKSSNLDSYKYNYENDEIERCSQLQQQQSQQQQQQQQQQPEKQTPGKYVCTYCNLACSKPSVLQKHIRAHTNERPYPCVSCGFSFKTRSNLYKHCRSRTHANRVLGSKARGELNANNDEQSDIYDNQQVRNEQEQEQQQPDYKSKLYKPRFHTTSKAYYVAKENIEDENRPNSDILSHHINDIISKNNAKIDTYLKKKETFNSEYANVPQRIVTNDTLKLADEPLNLTNKSRKRCISEAHVESKSLIKELLLQNLSSDMQCPHCKMIFQTVTELELHKLRSCKGFVKPGAKYTRSSSVNVASILTQNKNAFDTIPQMQAVFPLKSPGPFLGKTRLVESDKSKSFSFDDGLPNISMYPKVNPILSPLRLQSEEKKQPVKLFGGEVKITEDTGESKSFNIENNAKNDGFDGNFMNYKMSENRVIKSSLHSGGTVLTNKGNFDGNIRGYDDDAAYKERTKRPPDLIIRPNSTEDMNGIKYTNIIDFSQNAVKLLTPNLKQPNLTVPGVPVPNKFTYTVEQPKIENNTEMYNPVSLVVNGKVVRYVPGMPGPVVAEPVRIFDKLEIKTSDPIPKNDIKSPRSPVIKMAESPSKIQMNNEKKFARPNSLALKPTSASLKQHHGLTPTMFNQILISPDTPRVAKKYVEQYLNGNYFSYLGLKSTTKPVYCTLNKTQPFYVPHFKKLSMYSEWRQQDTKTDKLYVAGYDSRQRSRRFTVAGARGGDLIAHSSYKYTSPDSSKEKEDGQKSNSILGGYECNDDYTYIRGRGRGRYVCEQCGIRCKKPSMLKKHIRTHSNDRPYTCSHCNFSFKTKGNLTKHMKSKAHNKNSTASSCSSSSTQQSGTPSSESETEDSGMDSSDESTRQQEHEAAYGLLSLSQKSTHNLTPHSFSPISTTSPINESSIQQHNSIMNIDEITHATKTNYAKNKILEQPSVLQLNNFKDVVCTSHDDRTTSETYGFVGRSCSNRPLTYPYVMSELPLDEPMSVSSETTDVSSSRYEDTGSECRTNIQQFHVIKKYTSDKDYSSDDSYVEQNVQKSVIVTQNLRSIPEDVEVRKRKLSENVDFSTKLHKNDEVIDLSLNTTQRDSAEDNVKLNGGFKNYNYQHYNGNLLKPNELNNGLRLSSTMENRADSPKSFVDFDNSAMETLADIATKQVKLEKNAMAKSVASEYLKLATKQEFSGDTNERFQSKEVNDLIVKPEGSKSCTICSKSFNKPSQLRLHMNVHYLERPFRCDSCSVSFRTKGHLQKHERSASHHNKLSSSPALSSSEPRPFKCLDCNIAFRIHGHLAKHLRSKMHIMKLECLAKIPFGLYAELERSNSLLTEINTTDGDQCLESLKTLAKKVFLSDPGKLRHPVLEPRPEFVEND